jgi:predicted  nucleic acid-binding Zn-ribbon protein
VDEQQVKEKLQGWFKQFRAGKPDQREQLQLVLGGALYIVLSIIALVGLEWKALKALIPLEVLRALIEVGLGASAIWLGLRVSDPARRGRLVFLFIFVRVAYAAIAYPLIVFLFYSAKQAAAVTFAIGFSAFSFLVAFLPSIYAASLRIKSQFPELDEGNRIATLTGGIITVIVLPFLALSLGLISLITLLGRVDPQVLAQLGMDQAGREALSRGSVPVSLGFFIMFVAFVFAVISAWSMRHPQLLRLKLIVARINFRFAYLCFGLGIAGLLFRLTKEGFWQDVWDVVPSLLTMVALAAIQIPALTGWWRVQILKRVRGDYSPAASSRIRCLMTRCARDGFVPAPDGLALQRAVTGLDVMDGMPADDASAAVAVKKGVINVKYKPSGAEATVKLLESEGLTEDRRIIGSLQDDFVAARRAFQLRRHGGDLRGQKRALEHQVPSLYQALGELADEKGVKHEPTAQYSAAIAETSRALHELGEQLVRHEEMLAELASDLDGKRAKHEGLISKAKEAADAAAAELSAARQKRTEAEGALSAARSAIEHAERGIGQGKARLEATGEMALSTETKKRVKTEIGELESQIKAHKTQVAKASSSLDKLRQTEEAKATKAAELQKELVAVRGEWSEVRSDLEGRIAQVERQTGDLAARGAETRDRLDEVRRDWGRALYEEARSLPSLRKAVAPIDENLEQQARLSEELNTTIAERQSLRPGVQRFTLFATVAGEALILLALFVILLVYAL